MLTYYEILEISSNSTTEQIRSAYIKQALLHHPDRNPLPTSPEKFKAVAQAYFILADPRRRRSYDDSINATSIYNPSSSSSAVSVDNIFGSVFNELLKPEMEKHSHYYTPVGSVAGGVLGFIVMNIPGLIAGAFFGYTMGSIRDRNGMSVYDAFCKLEGDKRHEILVALGHKMFSAIM